MVTTIFLFQVRDNLRSLRFQLSLLVLLLFFVANGVVYSYKLDRQATETERLLEADAENYEVSSVAEAVDNWYRIEMDPVGTEFVAEAGYAWAYTGMWVNPRSAETLWTTSSRTTNNWMQRFELVDWVVISRYVLTFLCIVLAYNAISGERERDTLRLLLTNPVSRSRILVGKCVAHLATLVAALIVGACVSLLILVITGVVAIDARVIAAAAVFVGGATLLCALFLLLGMAVSALSLSSATSLIVLVTAWTLVIVVVPQTSYLVAVRTVEPLGPFWEAMNDHRTQMRRALQLEGVQPRPREVARHDDFAVEREYARRLGQLEAELDAMRRDLNERIFRQFEVARTMNLLSPGYAFQYSVEALLGAGVPHFRAFFDDAWRYRDDLRQFLRAADAADPDSPHVLFLADYMSEAPVSADRIPRYVGRRLSLAEGLAAAVVPLVVLLLETTLAFFLALWAIQRTDIAAP